MSAVNATPLNYPDVLPVIPVRDMVVFPHMIVPMFVGRPKSLKALEEAMLRGRYIFIVSQKEYQIEDPKADDLYKIGTICQILQVMRTPEGTLKVLIEGLTRAIIDEFVNFDEMIEAKVRVLTMYTPVDQEIQALMRSVLDQFERYAKLHPKIPPETLLSVMNVDDPSQLADLIASHMVLKLKERQQLLEIIDPQRRLELILKYLLREIEILELEHKIHDKVRRELEKSQKEYYLREQLRAIQEELGDVDDSIAEIKELREKIEKSGMPEEVKKKAFHELRRLEKMPSVSAEATVARTYLDWLINLPWKKSTKDRLDISVASKVLNEDHYGLNEVKERILEFLAVRKLSPKEMKGQILCFVGPPGVGKTSLARSIARALNRKFVNMSLGGMRDEAEIRGHRRTYVGALPGRIIQKIRQVGVNNPVFLLDEVDKIGMDFRGDPSAALLEVLDPEQNHSFTDHFLEVPFDLSKVMFITTANVTHTIPRPLLDRMEVIHIPGYAEEEKMQIAKIHLIPKVTKQHGVVNRVRISDTALRRIIKEYTKEAGVRNLEREIAKICRKVARKIVEVEMKESKAKRSLKASKSKDGKKKTYVVNINNLEKYLGAPRFYQDTALLKDEIGVATGLAWTELGGDILFIESVVMKGKGNIILTGNLGDVMQESAKAALTYIRANAEKLNVNIEAWDSIDIHVHVPEGAIPKDGPSAGISLATSMCSAITGIPVRKDVAMTGEITLRGKVLPVGGVREKVLAAKRAGIRIVVLPKENEKDVKQMSRWAKEGLEFKFVEKVEDVFDIALVKK